MKHSTRNTLAHMVMYALIASASASSAMQMEIEEMPPRLPLEQVRSSPGLVIQEKSQALIEKQKTNWRFIKNAFEQCTLKPEEDNETYTKAHTILTNDPALYLRCFPYLVKRHCDILKRDLWLLRASADYYMQHRPNQDSFDASHIEQLVSALRHLKTDNELKLEELTKQAQKWVTPCAAHEKPIKEVQTQMARRLRHVHNVSRLMVQLKGLQEQLTLGDPMQISPRN